MNRIPYYFPRSAYSTCRVCVCTCVCARDRDVVDVVQEDHRSNIGDMSICVLCVQMIDIDRKKDMDR